MDNEIVILSGKYEIANITLEQPDQRITGKVRHSPRKCFRIAAKHRCGKIEVQSAIAISQAFQQPGPKESRSPGEEYPFVACAVPKRERVCKDMI